MHLTLLLLLLLPLLHLLHLQHFTKHEAQEAAAAVGRAPGAAASALGTAGAIVSGVAGHFVDKVGTALLWSSWLGACRRAFTKLQHVPSQACRAMCHAVGSKQMHKRAQWLHHVLSGPRLQDFNPRFLPSPIPSPLRLVCPSLQAKELGHNITQHGDFLSAEERTAKSKVGRHAGSKQIGVGTTVGRVWGVAGQKEKKHICCHDNRPTSRWSLAAGVLPFFCLSQGLAGVGCG